MQLGPEALLAVVETCVSEDPTTRAGGARVLQQLVSSPESPILTLKRLAADPDAHTRARAMKALGQLRPVMAVAIKALIAGLDDTAMSVRLAAIQGLGLAGHKAALALPELKKMAGETDSQLGMEAKRVILQIEASQVTTNNGVRK
jgi:HEAT repeat protein